MGEPGEPGAKATRRPQASASVLVELDAEECAELLADVVLGRVAVVVDGRPEVYPVFPVYDPTDGSIAFATNPATRLHDGIRWPFASFEADDLVPGELGWSVLVAGRAEEITDERTVERLAARRVVPWRGGPSVRWVRIVPSTTTGRRLVAFDRLPSAVPERVPS